ncbi:immunoglobulin superfamily member 6-like isoform X2 [Betta splendens]|uniref:immunoglobulin superfamily member 6-like isoform X2 n=1 Tax=Betta splendens TaxID=158456 RepID=UPI0010F67C07|nr:immunoglobulin superfamily member 6-like isoform X2 [Betta splendens]
MTFTWAAVVLCILSCSSASAFEFHTVEVHSGETVTLLCSNYTSSPTQIMWFRAVKKLKPRCISSLFRPSEPASFCEGFDKLKFQTSSNNTHIFLTIKRVDLSDSGLYFCGNYISKNQLIVGATYLEVYDILEEIVKLTSLVLGALTVFLTMVVIVLVIKFKKQHKAPIKERKPQRTESGSSDDFEYPPATLAPRPDEDLMPEPAQQLETDAVHIGSRNDWNCSLESD